MPTNPDLDAAVGRLTAALEVADSDDCYYVADEDFKPDLRTLLAAVAAPTPPEIQEPSTARTPVGLRAMALSDAEADEINRHLQHPSALAARPPRRVPLADPSILSTPPAPSGDAEDVERDIRAYAARSYGQAIEERPAEMIRWLLAALDDERQRYNEVAQEAYEVEEVVRLIEQILHRAGLTIWAAKSEAEPCYRAEAFYVPVNHTSYIRAKGETPLAVLRALAAQIERATP